MALVRTTRQSGFTLIEIMIVIAVIGVLSSIAAAAYQQYVQTAALGAITEQYTVAIDVAELQFSQAEQLLALGVDASTHVPDSAEAWISLFEAEDLEAPGGGPMFAEGLGDPVTGTIGLQVSGSWATNNLALTITRPGFAGSTAVDRTIEQL